MQTLINTFAEKHGIPFIKVFELNEYIQFKDYIFHIDTIKYDLQNNVPKWLILQWKDEFSPLPFKEYVKSNCNCNK